MPQVQFSMDEHGFPVFEGANVANSGATVTSTNDTGNKAHDTGSGKFAATPDAPKMGKAAPNTAPENQDPIEYKRMLDAARDAAREMDIPEAGDIKEFLMGRAKDPSKVDVEGFLKIVKEQKLTDLVDIIDQEIRTRGSEMRTGRRRVRVVSPKGYARRAFAALASDGVAELMHRLEAKGHSQAEVEQFVLGKVKDTTHDAVKQKRDALAAADEYDPDSWWLSFSEIDDLPELEPETPPIHITVQMPPVNAPESS